MQENMQDTQSTQASQERQIKKDILGDKRRYLTAGIMIVILGVVFYINSMLLIWLMLGVCFMLGFDESLKLFAIKRNFYLYLCAGITWTLAFFNSSPIQSGIFTAMILCGILAYRQKLEPRSILPFLYPTLPFLAIYAIYINSGISAIIWLIVTVAITDTGAYFGGRMFGKTPLSQTSPNKTLEGAGVGIGFGIIVGSILGISPSGGFIPALLVSIGVSITSVLGDLFESYLKRKANIKDSGSILPGHGGVLDRFDGILFGAVTMYFLLCFLPAWHQL